MAPEKILSNGLSPAPQAQNAPADVTISDSKINDLIEDEIGKVVRGLEVVRPKTRILTSSYNEGLVSQMTPAILRDKLMQYAILCGAEGFMEFKKKDGFDTDMFGGTEEGGKLLNEDGILVDPEHKCVVLADGMGGLSAGEIASFATLIDVYFSIADGLQREMIAYRACRYLHHFVNNVLKNNFPDIFARVDQRLQLGTTLSFVRAGPSFIEGFLVGDSPVFIVDLDTCEIIVKPILQQSSNPNENLITNCIEPLGEAGHMRLQPEFFYLPVPRGARYMALICSDGITDYVSDMRLSQIVMEDGENAWRKLIDLAKKNGTNDNTSAVQMTVENLL